MAVAEKIKEGYFENNARMEKLDVVFASRYLESYRNYTSGKSCSACWQLAFDSSKSWKPMVIQHLLAGMNAHISLDLGIAAATVSAGADINAIQDDFNKINEILNGLVNEVKTELYAMWPLSKILAKLNTRKIENEIAGFSMIIARDAAWQVAIDYDHINTTADREKYVSERDKKVAAFGNTFLSPRLWLQTLLAIFRIFEFGSTGGKIKKLNR